MKIAWPILLLLIYLKPATSTITCNDNDNCRCIQGQEYEFQCPQSQDPNENDYNIIHVAEGQWLQINCGQNLTKFDINLLPNITLEKIETFEIRFCPLPENGFKEILDWFSLKEVAVFMYENAKRSMENVTLKKDIFKGLDFVKHLSLKNNNLVDLEEDVFANTPNLVILNLHRNNLKLKSHLFKYTPLLKWLDLTENQLNEIPATLFHDLENLQFLHLWGNDLTEIDDLVFSRLTNLQTLEMRSNKIRTISENAFKNLIKLSSISLTKNRLKTLLGDIFVHNKKIEKIFLNDNNNLRIPRFLFSNLSLLQEVDLSNCNISYLPDDIFQNSENIKIVNLESNHLEHIPNNLFRGFSNLETINLNNNKIVDIDNPFFGLKKLKQLYLQNNKIIEIKRNVFEDLKSLEEINLEANQIRTIDDRAFYNNENLKIINLSRNHYSRTSISEFRLLENLTKLRKIDLSNNRIKDINDVIGMDNKVNLIDLNLSHNRISSLCVKDLRPLAKTVKIDLEYNNIKTVNFLSVELLLDNITEESSVSIINTAHNSLQCDCHNYDLVRYHRGELSPKIKAMFDINSDAEICGINIKNISPERLLCSFEQLNINGSCPESCSCNWRPSDTTVIVDCSDRNLSEFPHLNLSEVGHLGFNQTEMHLEGNSLVEGLDRNLTGYENISKLNLSHNEIETISWLPPKLEVLLLDNNKLEYLHYGILDSLNKSSLKTLVLNNNPWHCDCRALNLTNFLRQHTKMVLTDDITCVNSSRRLIDLNRRDLCNEFEVVHLVIILLVTALPIAIAAAVFYRYQQEIKIWLYGHNLCLWWVTQEELDKDKIYDAFISYSHKDEDFVVQNLLPMLEGGPNPYKLCLHYRHFIPGEFITTQITRSVLESRRTLVVLSKNFLESVWGKMEFRTAHTQAMTEGLARVIIVLYGDVDIDKLDDELKSYLKTNTYVKWGDPYFWNKLKYALPHSKTNVSKNKQKIANVMCGIDDKFNLVAPVTISSCSTPPVLAEDANRLKKNPISFKSSPEIDMSPVESGNLLVSPCL